MFFTDFFFYSFSFFQNPATPAAYGIQDLHNFVNLWLVIVFFPILSMLYLISKEAFYSKKNKNYHVTLVQKRYLNTFFHNPKLEIVWTILPAIILVIIAIPSFALLYAIDETIDPIKTVKAIGNQWFWEYEFFSKGKKNVISSYIIPTKDLVKGSPRLLDVDNPLILKSYQHIRILITSNDVLHSWAVPSLGIKLDAVPGRLNQTNLYLLRPGVFYGQCSELCGVGHGFMPIKVVSYSLFGLFLNKKGKELGDKLAETKQENNEAKYIKELEDKLAKAKQENIELRNMVYKKLENQQKVIDKLKELKSLHIELSEANKKIDAFSQIILDKNALLNTKINELLNLHKEMKFLEETIENLKK